MYVGQIGKGGGEGAAEFLYFYIFAGDSNFFLGHFHGILIIPSSAQA